MKKKAVYAILASAMLLCSACGKQNDIHDNAITTGENTQETSDASDTADAPTEERNTNTDTNTSENDGSIGADAGNTDSTQSADNAQQSLSISVEFQTKKNDAAEEDTMIYTSTVIYPVVSIEGNEDAADKINADIQAKVDSFFADTWTLDAAKEAYQFNLEDSKYPFIAYSSDLDFTVKRCDSNVISFTMLYYDYSGGAHPNSTTVGINYSAQTGDVIFFSELGKEPEAFHDNTFAYIKELAAAEEYQERFFPNTTPEEIEAVLYREEAWHLSMEGLTFISDPYALGPYVSGLIDFTIPYDALTEMGLKEEYQYAGNLIVSLEDGGGSCTMDINGDGKEDTVLLYTIYEGNADGSGDFVPHLIINDVDISQGYNEELEHMLTPWPTCALYDMNPNDDTIEIAISVLKTNEETNETYTFYTSFFRYEKDGSITYLGMTRGAADDPTMEISAISK